MHSLALKSCGDKQVHNGEGGEVEHECLRPPYRGPETGKTLWSSQEGDRSLYPHFSKWTQALENSKIGWSGSPPGALLQDFGKGFILPEQFSFILSLKKIFLIPHNSGVQYPRHSLSGCRAHWRRPTGNPFLCPNDCGFIQVRSHNQ